MINISSSRSLSMVIADKPQRRRPSHSCVGLPSLRIGVVLARRTVADLLCGNDQPRSSGECCDLRLASPFQGIELDEGLRNRSAANQQPMVPQDHGRVLRSQIRDQAYAFVQIQGEALIVVVRETTMEFQSMLADWQ